MSIDVNTDSNVCRCEYKVAMSVDVNTVSNVCRCEYR